jgi:hypothetical protein
MNIAVKNLLFLMIETNTMLLIERSKELRIIK